MRRKKRKPLGNPDSVNPDKAYRMAGIPLPYTVPSSVNVVNDESGEQEEILIWEKEGTEEPQTGGKQDVLANFHPSAMNLAIDNQRFREWLNGIVSETDTEFMLDYVDTKYERSGEPATDAERARFSRLLKKLKNYR